MARRNNYESYASDVYGSVKHAKMSDGKMLGFIVKNSRSKRTKTKEEPSPEVRRIIAQNIDKIEKQLGTRFLKTSDGVISKTLGSGYWGVVFRLANGNVLKVSTDTTEGGSAFFWKENQSKNPDLLSGTAKVYKVFSIRRAKDRKYFYFIEREEVDPTSYVPYQVRQYLNKFVDEFHQFCSTSSQRYAYLYLERAKIAIEGLARHSKSLSNVLSFAWNKGLPLIDASEQNLGVRIRKDVGGSAKLGQWVIFDFGGLSPKCFDLVVKDSKGENTNIKGLLKTYCKKVPVLK